MSQNNKNSKPLTLRGLLIIAVIIIIVSFVRYGGCGSNLFDFGPNLEKVRRKMKQELKEKYGEEFVVGRIGTRKSLDETFYQARIYPKSIVGTKKEKDDYYYASASVDKLPLGRLGDVGDSYALVNLKSDIEDALHPKIESIFGKRFLSKAEAHYKKREPGNETFWGYKVNSYKAVKDSISKDPENRMVELTLYLYIFDRIDNQQEKEKRRQDIFEFVQYLKEEGLFRYLEMGVIFIDERVLAPSYDKYKDKMYDYKWETKDIKGETIELPPDSFRIEMSKQLQSEIDTMSDKQLIENINGIRKCELEYEGINQYNSQYISNIYSKGKIKIRYSSWLNNGYKPKDFEEINNVEFTKVLDYIYLN